MAEPRPGDLIHTPGTGYGVVSGGGHCDGPTTGGPGPEPATIKVAVDDLNELIGAAGEAAEDLEAALGDRYPDRAEQPSLQRRFERDMEPVRRLRAVLVRIAKDY